MEQIPYFTIQHGLSYHKTLQEELMDNILDMKGTGNYHFRWKLGTGNIFSGTVQNDQCIGKVYKKKMKKNV